MKYVIRGWEKSFGLFKENESTPVVVMNSPKKLAKAAWNTGAHEVRHEYDGSKLPPEEK